MRITIKTKLILSFTAVLALLGTAGYFGISSLGVSNDTMKLFAERPIRQVDNLQAIAAETQNLRRATLPHVHASDPEAKTSASSDYEGSWTRIDDSLKILMTSVRPERVTEIEALAKVMDDLRATTDAGMKLSDTANLALSEDALTATKAPFDAIRGEVASLRATGNRGADAALPRWKPPPSARGSPWSP